MSENYFGYILLPLEFRQKVVKLNLIFVFDVKRFEVTVFFIIKMKAVFFSLYVFGESEEEHKKGKFLTIIILLVSLTIFFFSDYICYSKSERHCRFLLAFYQGYTSRRPLLFKVGYLYQHIYPRKM